ncbi:MAG: NAD-dependent DNA ligase LigA, partial [Clostridiaceae bacterium]
MKEAEKNIKQLIEILNKHSYNYYALDNPTISDKEYDKLYDNLVSLEKETNIIFPYSPTRRIGDEVLGEFSKYTHKGKLWSLDKAQTYEELENWLNKNKKFISDYNNNNDDKLPELQYVLTKKFDGLTINLSYDEEGILTRGTTRGTGFIGENVTNQTKTIKSIPLKIENGFFMEVHGEAVMTKEAFIKYNEEAKVPLKNLRNGAAGALRNLNIQETAKRNLSAYFYDVGYTEGKTFESYVEMMEFIKKMGLPVDKYMEVCTELHEIEKQIEYINEIRQDLNYDIDGVVIAIDDIRTREAMGYTVKFPKWALAFKFEAEEATTKLLEVEWNVGRSGRISPTAILEPVDIGGATVKRATLNNMDDINRKNVKINSNVFIRRSNDVIPEIMGVSEDSKDEIEIIPPKVCPYC